MKKTQLKNLHIDFETQSSPYYREGVEMHRMIAYSFGGHGMQNIPVLVEPLYNTAKFYERISLKLYKTTYSKGKPVLRFKFEGSMPEVTGKLLKIEFNKGVRYHYTQVHDDLVITPKC